METNSPVKILMVDDRPENLLALEVILSNRNYLCVQAGSGLDALRILENETGFAIILMDVLMPGINGFETVELIRKMEDHKLVPVIFLTASMDAIMHVFKGYEVGAVDYMIKPLSPEILRAKVAVFADLYLKTQEILAQKEQVRSLNSYLNERIRFEKELIEAKRKAEISARIAEDAVKAKQQFLSNMSHEIRTPMNAIIGFTSQLMKTALTGNQKKYLSAIKISGDALIVLINDILDLAKVDAGKMIFEETPFNVAASISAMLRMFETKLEEKKLTLRTLYDKRLPKILIGDATRLHQIILNLVSNAVKFTSKGTITVSVQMLSEDEDKVQIEFVVTDTGIGIPADRITTIFENFQQASNETARLYGGTGLGLAIVKQLVEKQGGKISVTSKIDQGSSFRFIIDFKKNMPETSDGVLGDEEDELSAELKNVKVLIVEDIELNQMLITTLLDDFGYEYEIASNGKIAIEKLQNQPFDIVLMDLQMPVMGGFEATAHIRGELNSDIPIIALTADVTTVDLAKCKSAGMDDYLSKPVDEKLLHSKIIEKIKKSN